MFNAIISDFSNVLLLQKKNAEACSAEYQELNKLSETAWQKWPQWVLNTDLGRIYREAKAKSSEQLDFIVYTNIPDPEVKELTDLLQIFDSCFSASQLGLSKTKSADYLKLCEIAGIDAKSVIFIDDESARVDAAAKIGMTGIVYRNNFQLQADLTQILSTS